MAAPVLGISAFFHNAAAAISINGVVVAALEEERASRLKNDPAWPKLAIESCLHIADIYPKDLDSIAFYERPLGHLSRNVIVPSHNCRTALAFQRMTTLITHASKISSSLPVYYFPHHLSHAASAFLPSCFESAAVVVVDGVGETICTSIWQATPADIRCLRREAYPHSFGLFYSYITEYLGFRALYDEYKVMGLAAWGEPRYRAALQQIIRFDYEGRVRLDPDWQINVLTGSKHPNALDEALLGPRRNAGESIEQRHKDIAASLQSLLIQWLARLVNAAKKLMPKETNLCLAGGIAHNCRAIGEIQEYSSFDKLFIQPAAGDAGGAIGAALLPDFIRGNWSPLTSPFNPYLGPSFMRETCLSAMDAAGCTGIELEINELIAHVSQQLMAGRIIGWFEGRAEFGPRALGNRSILANPLIADISSTVNIKIKQRESFRPFAPAVLAEHASRYFSGRWMDRYMLVTAQTQRSHIQALNAITHVDGSARVQLVDRQLNPLFHQLISQFEIDSGYPVVLNTSLNHSSEPIALTPVDAIKTARLCNLDGLALGKFYIDFTDG